MRRVGIFWLLILAGGVAFVQAQTTSKKSKIEQISETVAAAYASRDLGRLDKLGLLRGGIRIVIYHSLTEGEDEVDLTFSSFKRAERWLSKYGPDPTIPNRGVGEFTGCGKGTCGYQYSSGILHNHLYLSDITYGFRHGRYYIRSIVLMDGD